MLAKASLRSSFGDADGLSELEEAGILRRCVVDARPPRVEYRVTQEGLALKGVLDALVASGVFVRMPGVASLNRCIRVTAGTDADLDILEKELPAAIAAAG